MGVGCGLPDYMDEAAQREGASPARRRRCKASSEGLNLERKEETVEMWLLVGGGGGDLDISAVAENLRTVQRKTGAQVWLTRGRWTVADEPSCVSHT
jgi:hypothetical protein